MRRAARAGLLLAFMLAAVVLTSTWIVRDTPVYAPRPPTGEAYWRTLDPAQLSWVAEGIMERISALQDELDAVRAIQEEMLAARASSK